MKVAYDSDNKQTTVTRCLDVIAFCANSRPTRDNESLTELRREGV